MRLPITCMQRLETTGAICTARTLVEFRDDFKYELKCSNGHTTTTILQQQRFELLFDIGAYAIIDGYYREAVSSFAASLERFYEFAIRAILSNSSGSDKLFQDCWKAIKNLSERQIGGFLFIWAGKFQEKPEMLSTDFTGYRNDVIHKGRIPTKEEAIKFGNAVLKVLRHNMLALRERIPDSVNDVIQHHISEAQAKDATDKIVIMCASTIVSLSAGDPSHHEGDLEHHLNQVSKFRWN